MSCYIIGDVHGCFQELTQLLALIEFDPTKDQLFFTGDLVNRGPDSLGCLRLAKKYGAQMVLGNHDLHLLACYTKVTAFHRNDTLETVLKAPDCDELMQWLRHCPLMIHTTEFLNPFCLVHAGILPEMSVEQAIILAKEVEAQLQKDNWREFMPHLYGNTPNYFDPALSGWMRLRSIVNVMTRMRYITAEHALDFRYKGNLSKTPTHLRAWFQFARQDDVPILFGHWAALNGVTPNAQIDCEALDTGCVWNGSLTALNWPNRHRSSVAAHPKIDDDTKAKP